MEIYTAPGKKLNDKVMSVLENNLGVHYHVYQDNLYNSVNLVENLLKHKITVCGKIRPNMGIPKALEKQKSRMKPDKFVSFVFCHFTKGAVMKNITPCNIIRSFLC